MRVVVQRVSQSNVKVSGEVIGEINEGLMVLVSFVDEDNDTDLDWMTKKIINLRIFNDDEGKMNRSVQDVSGDILLISQFTLHGSTKKGNRPSFIKAAKPDFAKVGDKLQVDILGEMYDATVLDESPYDSENKLLRA